MSLPSRCFALVFSVGSLLTGATIISAAEKAANAPADGTHRVQRHLKVAGVSDRHQLQSFALGPQDEIFALVAKGPRYGVDEEELVEGERGLGEAAPRKPAARPAAEPAEVAPAQVQVFALDGKLLREWKLDFIAQRIAVAPDGTVYVGGTGKLVKFSTEGRPLAEIVAPQMQAFASNANLMREQAEEQLKEEREQAERMVAGFERKIEQLRHQVETQPADALQPRNVKPKKAAARRNTGTIEVIEEIDESQMVQVELSENESITIGVSKLVPLEQQLRMVESYGKMYAEFAERAKKQTVEQVLAEMRKQKSGINAITVSEKDLFVATPMMKGYGFSVWRLSPDLTSPEQIVKQLSGCCGQMDLQCRGDSLYVAENGRHRVQEFDRTGEKLASWGQRDRNGKPECFGGCCNPMNLCFDNLGRILTAESEGVVKAFDKDGQFQTVVGKAPVSGGCKNVAIATTKDGRHLLFYDQAQSQIIILAAAHAPSTDK